MVLNKIKQKIKIILLEIIIFIIDLVTRIKMLLFFCEGEQHSFKNVNSLLLPDENSSQELRQPYFLFPPSLKSCATFPAGFFRNVVVQLF